MFIIIMGQDKKSLGISKRRKKIGLRVKNLLIYI